MKDICQLINKILQNKEIFGQKPGEYSYRKINITTKNFSDKQEAAVEFFSLKDRKGWFCDTSTPGVRRFSKNDVRPEELGWIIEGEAVSQNGKISSRISQNSFGGWTVQYFEDTDGKNGQESITRNVSLRQIHGNKITYQIGYCLDNDGKLSPDWQRLLDLSLD